MAILHKNINNESDIHVPKWLPSANNGDYAFKNEKGELESIDELLLPAALNFVDGSVAPPTTSVGDIYILSSGASVNAGWGSVALQDWVRYDGALWNSLTPQKSSLCYDKTADALMSFNGAAWAAIGAGGGTDANAVHVNVGAEISAITAKATPTTSDIILIEDAADSNNKKKITIGDLPSSGGNTIYSANDTIGTGRVATLTDSLTIKDGTFKVQGLNTLTTASALQIYDGDGTPNLLWDFKNDGTLIGNKSKTTLIAQNSTSNDLNQFIIQFGTALTSGLYGVITNTGYFQFGSTNSISNTDFTTCFQLGHFNTINTSSAYFGNIGNNNNISGSGNYRYVVGKGNTTTAGSEQVILGVDNSVSSNFGSMIGSEGVLSGTYGVAIGRAHNVTSQFSVALGAWTKPSASGASVIGHGVEADKTQKLENSTSNSLALGWNSTTPQHLFKSTGVNLTLPTSSSGLSSGDLYNDGGTVKIV